GAAHLRPGRARLRTARHEPRPGRELAVAARGLAGRPWGLEENVRIVAGSLRESGAHSRREWSTISPPSGRLSRGASMKRLLPLVPLLGCWLTGAARGENWITYEGKSGPGQGKHVVFLSGDEEYRSEEGLPMLAKILSQRHGFKCTVLFALGAD